MASKFPVNGIVNNDSRHERHGSPTGYSRRREYDSKQARSRSRSPYRANKKVRFDGPSEGHGGKYQAGNTIKDERRSRDKSYDDRQADSRRDARVRSVSRSPPRFSKRELPPKPTVSESARDADKKISMQPRQSSREQSVVSDVSEDATTIGEAAASTDEVLDEAALIEQRRKRREAIRAKHQGKEPNLLQTATSNAAQHPSLKTPEKSTSAPKSQQKSTPPDTPVEELSPASEDIDLAFDEDMANTQAREHGDLQEDEPSAADYDPSQDMQKDKLRQEAKALDESSRNDTINVDQPQAETAEVDEDDMFGGEDDMFADTAQPIIDKPAKKVAVNGLTAAKALDANLLDDWDDPEGYYKVIIDELIDGRYHVQASLGKGMFSGVIRAFDQETKQLVAIKIIRNKEIMRKAAAKEIKILQNLTSNDPKNKKHVVRLERTFEHKGHLCMVFENLNINLREVLKKFGRDVGINLKAVRIYAQQIFIGLHHLRECKIVHADLKPDNILINDSREVLKIADLGSATEISESEIIPYLVSRFYRAPEIILGQKYDYSIDVWSIGCTLFELYTGKILFTGRSNNQMLRVMMECRGKFSPKMLKSSSAVLEHFDPTLQNFQSIETDKISGRQVVRSMNVNKPIRSLRSRLMANADGMSETEQSELKLFIDLLEKCLQLDPEKRCTPAEALKHPFIYRAKK